MKKTDKLFTAEELAHMNNIFAQKKEYLKNNPKASSKFTSDKGKYDTEGLARQLEHDLNKNIKNLHKTDRKCTGK